MEPSTPSVPEASEVKKKTLKELYDAASKEIPPYYRTAKMPARDVPTLQAALDTMFLILEDYHHEWTEGEKSLYDQANKVLTELVVDWEF